MKKSKCIISLSLTMLLLILTSSKVEVAYEWMSFRNKMVVGRDIAYMIKPGCEYTVAIPRAVNKLMYPPGLSNNLVLSATNNYQNSKMDFKQYARSDKRNGYADVFRKNYSNQYYNSNHEMNSYDWVYGEVNINDTYMDGHSPEVREAVIVHEMLHVYGVAHNDSIYSIMYPNTPQVYNVTIDANTVVNQKY